MAPLRNQKHEKYALALFEGKPQNQAYVDAGYRYHEGNASRLRRNEKVIARLSELQTQAAKSTKITVQSICAELDDAMAVARSKHQAQAMVSASSMKAKLNGLLTERVEIGPPGSFDGCNGMTEIVDEVLERLVIERFLPCDAKDRQGLIDLYERHLAEIDAYISAIQSRPLLAERVNVRRLDTPWQQLETHSAPARLRSNGSVR